MSIPPVPPVPPIPPVPPRPLPPGRWQAFKTTALRTFHAYGSWLVGISWKRFVLLSVLLLILSGVLQNIPPFSWSYTRIVHLPELDLPPEAPAPVTTEMLGTLSEDITSRLVAMASAWPRSSAPMPG